MTDGGELGIETESWAELVTIHVTDEGEGISKDNIEKIFDPLTKEQKEKLDDILTIRQEQMDIYYNCLKDISEIELRKFEKKW